MSDARCSVHRQVPRLNRWAGSLIFILQHPFPKSRHLEILRKKNALRAARKMKPGGVVQIERRKDLGEREFVSDYLKKGIPVIFEGQAIAWPCTKKWGLDFLKDQYGDETLSMVSLPELAKGEDQFRGPEEGMATAEVQEISARDFVDSIRNGARNYLRPCEIMETRTELQKDLDLGWLKKMQRSVLGVSFQSFLGAGGRTTPLHCEPRAFFFVLAEGEKRWTLIPPASSVILNPSPEGRACVISRVKINNPDLSQYPGFDRLTRYTCHLKKGDILFIPSWTWHEVETFTETWGVSYRFNYVRGFVGSPAFTFARMFLAKPSLLRTLYYGFFKRDPESRQKTLFLPRLFLK